MLNSRSVESATAPVRRRPGREVRGRFFVWMACLLLILNLIGFAPTYFLRSWFGGPALHARTHLHGVLFTGWFVLFVIQSLLVARGRLRLHRRLGVIGACLAACMVVSGLVILYYGVLEFQEAGGSIARAGQFLWGNLALLTAFGGFVVAAITLRRHAEAHKRLILLASLAMILQSLGRIGSFGPLRIGSAEASEAVYALGGLAALLAVTVTHDIMTRGRPHPAVLWGSPLLLGSILIGGLLLPATALGEALVRLIY